MHLLFLITQNLISIKRRVYKCVYSRVRQLETRMFPSFFFDKIFRAPSIACIKKDGPTDHSFFRATKQGHSPAVQDSCLRFAPVVAERSSPGRAATRLSL